MVDFGLIVNVVLMCNLDYNGYIFFQVVFFVLEVFVEILVFLVGFLRNSFF